MNARFFQLRRLVVLLAVLAAPSMLFAQYNITGTTPTSFLSGVTTNQSLVVTGSTLPTAFGPGGYGYCFYTGYGASATPLVPSSGNATAATLSIPASSINSIPAGAFVAGSFLASLNVIAIPGSGSATCSASSTVSNTANVVIAYSPSGGGGGSGSGSGSGSGPLAVNSVAPALIYQTNPSTNLPAPPQSVLLSGSGFVAPTTVSFAWGSGSANATVIYESASTLQVKLPVIPAGVTSITATVCNAGPTCVTSPAVTVSPLASTSGTTSATPTPGTVGSPSLLSALITGTSTPGAPSGTVTINNNGVGVGNGRLVLDTTTGAFATGGNGSLASPPTITPVTGDVNGDGIPDMMYADSVGQLHVLLGTTPVGSFQPDVTVSNASSTCYIPGSVVLADFNGDGLADVAYDCTDFNGATQVYVSLSNGDGSFQNPNALTSPVGIQMFAADMNKDGKLDLVLVGLTSGTTPTEQLSVYTGNGNGTFNASTITALPSPGDAASPYFVTDVDGDGYPDIVHENYVPGATTGSIDIFRNQNNTVYGVAGGATNTPTYSVPLQPSQYTYSPMAVAQLVQGSGLPSFALGFSQSGTTQAYGVVTYLNASKPGTILFNAGPTATLPAIPFQISFGDFNGDGLTDIVAGAPCQTSCNPLGSGLNLYVLAGDGNGNFTANYPNLNVTGGVVNAYFLAALQGNGYTDVLSEPVGETLPTIASYIPTGKANLSTNFIPTADGVNALTLSYPGDFYFTGTSLPLSLPVNGSPVTVSVGSTLLTAQYGQPVTLTASVTSAVTNSVLTSLGSPAGSVSFYDGGKLVGQSLVVAGVASLSLSNLTAGPHSITAAYAGSTVYAAGSSLTSVPVSITPVTPTLTWKPTPTTLTYGTALTSAQLNAIASSQFVTTIPGTYKYSVAVGQILTAGSHTLQVTFTPTDTVDYATATGSAVIQVSQATPTLSWKPTPTTLTYGTALTSAQLNAIASSLSGTSIPGTFQYSVSAGQILTAGSHTLQVTFTPTDTVDYATATGSAAIQVSQAAPTLIWAAPAPIVMGTPLSAVQLDATASGPLGAVAGQFTYSPALGAILPAGVAQKLTVSFVPTDTVDYTGGSASTTLTVISLTIAQVAPATIPVGAPSTLITLTGTGFQSNSVVNANGKALATTYLSATQVTATVPSTLLQTSQSIQITVTDPSQSVTSNAISEPIEAPTPSATFNGPSTAAPAEQPTLTFTLNAGYPLPLTGTATLSFVGANGVDDPAIQFASGGRTLTFTVPANSTVTPAILLQSGTVSGTITVSLTLTAGGQDVTPTSIVPIHITVPLSAPGITSATLTRSGNLLHVTIIGYSNSREMTSATFDFTAASGYSLAESESIVPVVSVFKNWFSNPASLQYGSEFKYTQTFLLSQSASAVGSVTITLTNSTGTSVQVTAK